MAYNKTYYYRKIVEIQEITLLEQKERGSTLKWIYENKIKDIYHISYSTYSNYLGIPAKAKLKELE